MSARKPRGPVRIEGSQLDEEQTRYIYETRTISGDDVRVDDVVETVNSFELFDQMIDNHDQPITAQTLKDYHRTLKSGTNDARTSWFAVGDWKEVANAVGGRTTTRPEHVALAIEDLLVRTPQAGSMTFQDIVDFHYGFESIHPFQDGNGRVGRIVMFQQCIQNRIMPFIVLDEQKAFYYRGLAEYEDEPGFLRETFRSFQDQYYARFAPFVPPAPLQQQTAQDVPARNQADHPRRFPELRGADSEEQNADQTGPELP